MEGGHRGGGRTREVSMRWLGWVMGEDGLVDLVGRSERIVEYLKESGWEGDFYRRPSRVRPGDVFEVTAGRKILVVDEKEG